MSRFSFMEEGLGVDRFIREYAGIPSLAGQAAEEVIGNLPRDDNRLTDAFLALQTLNETRQELLDIVIESVDFSDPRLARAKKFRSASHSLFIDPHSSIDSFVKHLKRDLDEEKEFQKRVIAPHTIKKREPFEFDYLDPPECYRFATQTLCCAILTECMTNRLSPLITRQVTNFKELQTYITHIQALSKSIHYEELH